MAKRTSRKRHSRKRTSKNGWGRRASRGLKGKRRSRAKRTSRRNTSYYYEGMSHPESYDRRGRPRRNSRKAKVEWAVLADARPLAQAEEYLMHRGYSVKPGSYDGASGSWLEWQTGTGWKAKLHKTSRGYEVHGEVGNTSARRNGRRRSRPNQTYYIPIPPRKNSRRRRTSRRNQTYYVLSPGPARNPRLSKKRRSKLPASKFVFPKDRAWPIESARGARDAIRYMKMGRVRSASDFMAIRTFILKHYPAVWREYGLGASWQKSHAAHVKGIAHRRTSMRAKHKMAANARRRRR